MSEHKQGQKMRLRRRIEDNKFEVLGIQKQISVNREKIKTGGLDEGKKYYL